jgi:hypothetical protein
MATFVNDTFSGHGSLTGITGHTGELGATWTQDSGYGDNFVVTPAGRAYPGDSQSADYTSGTPASAEYDVEADLVCLSNTGNTQICGRMASNATMYMAGFFNGVGWQIYYQNAGSFSSALDTNSSSHGTSLTISQVYALRFEIRNATKRLYVDDVLVLSTADNTVTAAGKAGVRGAGAAELTGYHLDNFTAYDPVVGGAASRIPNARRAHRFFRRR